MAPRLRAVLLTRYSRRARLRDRAAVAAPELDATFAGGSTTRSISWVHEGSNAAAAWAANRRPDWDRPQVPGAAGTAMWPRRREAHKRRAVLAPAALAIAG